MRKYVWPVIAIVLPLLVAGAWVAFPQERESACSAVSSFLASFVAETKAAWGRAFGGGGDAEPLPEPDDPSIEELAAPAIPTKVKAAASDDPDPSSLTPEQRKRKYRELVAAAKARKMEVMRSNLMKCPDGKEALEVTRAFHAKAEEMKRLEAKYGATDDRVALIRIEMVALRESVQVANARYRTWKEAHPSEVVDPLADKIYCDLIARSRFYLDR